MWKCPSLCDESLIQNPTINPKYVGETIVQVSCCPLCGKELMFYIENRRTSGFIITKERELK